MGFVISICNNKGGCSKTTTTCNLADALARKRRRVLVLDLDSQCNATSLLRPRTQPLRRSFYEYLEAQLAHLHDGNEPAPNIEECVYSSESGVRLIPNVEETSALEPDMITFAPASLRCLLPIRDYGASQYDYTLIDLPPNLGSFVLASLFASDFVIVPVWASSAFAIEGLNRAVKLIERVQEQDNQHLRFLKLLIAGSDKRKSVARQNIDQLRSMLPPERIFKTEIPFNEPFQAAERLGKTIFQHDGQSAGARSFRRLADELIAMLEPSRQQELLPTGDP